MEIRGTNVFVTPEDMDDLVERLNSFSGSEKSVAWLSAMMAWNLACKMVNEMQKDSNKLNNDQREQYETLLNILNNLIK